jgi:hypothetical protein
MPKINWNNREIYFNLDRCNQQLSSYAKDFKGTSREPAIENTKC